MLCSLHSGPPCFHRHCKRDRMLAHSSVVNPCGREAPYFAARISKVCQTASLRWTLGAEADAICVREEALGFVQACSPSTK